MNKELLTKKIKWLQLIRSPGIGPIKFWKLLSHFGCIDKALASLNDPFSEKSAEKELELSKKKSIQLVAAFEDQFPKSLKRLVDCPPLISVCGNLSLLNAPCFAIVGARNASLGGKKLAYEFAHNLGEVGFNIVSGLARGIDEAAHKGSLSTGTIAVLAGGVDYIYPPEHKRLYNDIVEKGVILSEMPLSLPPAAPLFLKRNRLIAALSQGVIVIEAARKSGSLITAQCALELGIDVFAVPGSPLDPRCQGCNGLLKQGATLVESAADILDSLKLGYPYHVFVKPSLSSESENFKIEVTDLKNNLLNDLSHVPIAVEKLMQNYSSSPAQFLSLLCELELTGQVQRHPGNLVSLSLPKK